MVGPVPRRNQSRAMHKRAKQGLGREKKHQGHAASTPATVHGATFLFAGTQINRWICLRLHYWLRRSQVSLKLLPRLIGKLTFSRRGSLPRTSSLFEQLMWKVVLQELFICIGGGLLYLQSLSTTRWLLSSGLGPAGWKRTI